MQTGASTASASPAWHPGGDSNTQWRVWNPLASPSATGACGAPGRIRTSTLPLLRRVPLPVGLRAHGTRGEIRTRHCSVPKTDASCQLGYSGTLMVGRDGVEPPSSPANRVQGYGLLPDRSANVPQLEMSKIWRKAGDSNAYVRLGTWLSRPVGYQLPKPSGTIQKS